jgi:hypothetical protein
VAGTDLEKFIRATDPDGHQVSIGSESAIFSTDREVFPSSPPATLTPFATMTARFQDSPAQSCSSGRRIASTYGPSPTPSSSAPKTTRLAGPNNA